MGNPPYDFFLINPHIAKTTNTPEDMYGDVVVLTNTVFIHFLINERVRSTYNVSLHITELIFLEMSRIRPPPSKLLFDI